MTLRHDIETSTPALRRLAQALAGRGRGAEDSGDNLVHETILRALRHDTPSHDLSVRNWLYANLISVNRQRVRLQASEGVAGRSLRQGNSGGLRGGSRRGAPPATDTDVAGALLRLPLEEREAILLVALEGVGYAQAAAILGLPRPVLVARLARARANLSALTEQGGAPADEASRMAAGAGLHLRLVK